jgi:spore maturation protein CgeB
VRIAGMRPLARRIASASCLAPVHAWLKGRVQERQAARSRAEALRLLRNSGRQVADKSEVAIELRKRRAVRRPQARPADKGQLHVFLAYYVSNWERILPLSLAPFGRVSAFEWRSHGFDDTRPDWLGRREAMNHALLKAFDDANRSQPVDAVVGYMSGRTVLASSVRQMTASGALVFNFCWDDKLWFPGPLVGDQYTSPAGIASDVDLNLTNAPDSVEKYAAYGGLAMFWPEAAHPEVHRPYDVAFDYDVSFVGQRYGWRPGFIQGLRARGIPVTCFGRGWEGGPLSDEEMIRLYSRSRINLGFGGIGFSKRLMCLKGRDFEVPMSGGLYLTQHNPELERVYEVGREIVTYHDIDDCARQIRRLLSSPADADAIRRAGRARALAEHTYERRYDEIFSLAGLLRPGGS